MNEAEKLYDFYKDQKARQPYHINLIDELHANENAHTRILVKLLQYQKKGKFLILDSFLSRLENKISLSALAEKNKVASLRSDFLSETPQIIYGKEYIDALIRYPHHAIIIENKIHWASDQFRQIQSYVENVKEKKMDVADASNIFVIYLTANENKKASEESLTLQAKKELGYVDDNNTGRFVQLTYTSDILPWLTDDVLPSCTIGEEWLVSALQQYIDHLKGMFGLRDGDKVIWENVYERVSVETVKDFLSLQHDSPAYQFMNDLVLRLKQSLEKTFCDRILNSHLLQFSLNNPGGWYPDFGGKWGSIECSDNNLAKRSIGLEKFVFGFPSNKGEFSKEWSKFYWEKICAIFPDIRRNDWYWLGKCYFPDTDFCSSQLLIQALSESGTRWENSPTLNEKAKKIATYIAAFYQAVQTAFEYANKQQK